MHWPAGEQQSSGRVIDHSLQNAAPELKVG